jgi:hypothetical protein
MLDMKRRFFITLLVGAAAWPLAARAQQAERMRRIGVLMAMTADDPESQARLAAFAQGLQQSGWTVGQNVRVDYRWSSGNADNMRKYAAELVALAPDVILAHSSAAVAPLLQATRTIPIVFTTVSDPVGAGYVDSLARPGGNATGFLVWEYSIAGKWLELLKEIAPRVTWTASSSPRLTRCNTVCRETPRARIASRIGRKPAAASALKRAFSSSVRRMRQGAPGVICSPATKPSFSRRWIVDGATPSAKAVRLMVTSSPSAASAFGTKHGIFQ